MNLLVETPPDYIIVRGKKLKINTSFGLWVELIISSKKDDKKKAENAINKILCEKTDGTFEEVITECLKWLSVNNETEKTCNTSKETTSTSVPFDFEIDGNIIYCELWEYFPHLMERGISYHEGIELIKIIMHNENSILWHRAFARCGDFSKMDKDHKQYWQKQRAMYIISNMDDQSIDDVFARAF